jgi:hypothetical protein
MSRALDAMTHKDIWFFSIVTTNSRQTERKTKAATFHLLHFLGIDNM